MASGSFGECELHALRATNRWPPTTTHPPRAFLPCVFGVRHPSVEPRQSVFVTQASSWGAWLGVAVRRRRRDAGVELKSSRTRQQKFLKEFNLDFSDVALVSPVRTNLALSSERNAPRPSCSTPRAFVDQALGRAQRRRRSRAPARDAEQPERAAPGVGNCTTRWHYEPVAARAWWVKNIPDTHAFTNPTGHSPPRLSGIMPKRVA